MADQVQIFEVGPRDGLQNESRMVSLEDKLWFISGLIDAGVRDMEIGAFVRPDRVRQMADTDDIYRKVNSGEFSLGKARAWSLVPNLKGLERAQALKATRLAVFTAASESFTQKNIGMSIDQSLREFKAMIETAPKIKFRGYISTAFGCPFEGKIAPAKVLKVIERLARLGVEQISVGDTIGVGTPGQVDKIVKPALKMLGPKRLAVHFHDTRGTALANTLRSLEHGVRIVDSSAGGLGGCPFAPGATGNLATEDLVYMLDGLGMKSGVRLEKLASVSLEFARRMKRPISSRYLQAYAAACAPTP